MNAVGGSAAVTVPNNTTTFRTYLGYKLNENFDFETGYFKTGTVTINFIGKSGSNVNYSGSASDTFSSYDISTLLRPNSSSGLNGLFLRLGAHNTTQDVSATVTVGSTTVNSFGSTSSSGFLGGVGYDREVSQNLSARGELLYYNNVGSSSVLLYLASIRYDF